MSQDMNCPECGGFLAHHDGCSIGVILKGRRERYSKMTAAEVLDALAKSELSEQQATTALRIILGRPEHDLIDTRRMQDERIRPGQPGYLDQCAADMGLMREHPRCMADRLDDPQEIEGAE